MTTLTNNEVDILKAFCDPAQAEGAKGDLGSTWTDAEELATMTGKTVRSVVGILGSLSKKGLIYADQEGGERGEITIQCLSEDGCDVLSALAPKADENEDHCFETQAELAKHLYSRKGKVFVSVPTVGGAIIVQAVKIDLYNQLMANPEAKTHFICEDLADGDFQLYSPVN